MGWAVVFVALSGVLAVIGGVCAPSIAHRIKHGKVPPRRDTFESLEDFNARLDRWRDLNMKHPDQEEQAP